MFLLRWGIAYRYILVFIYMDIKKFGFLPHLLYHLHDTAEETCCNPDGGFLSDADFEQLWFFGMFYEKAG